MLPYAFTAFHLFVGRVSQKVMDGLAQNFVEGLVMGQERTKQHFMLHSRAQRHAVDTHISCSMNLLHLICCHRKLGFKLNESKWHQEMCHTLTFRGREGMVENIHITPTVITIILNILIHFYEINICFFMMVLSN